MCLILVVVLILIYINFSKKKNLIKIFPELEIALKSGTKF